MLNWIIWNWTVFDIETVLTLNWIVIYNCLNKLNSLKYKCFWQLNCVLMLNWIVWNRTDYLHKNRFGYNNLQKLIHHKTKPNQTKSIYIYIYIYYLFPYIYNILRKNQNGFQRNRSTTSQILTIRRILEGVWAKNLQTTLLFVDFTKAFDSIHRGKMELILLAYGLPKETVAAIMILYSVERNNTQQQ